MPGTIGTSIAIVPLHNPVQLAESYAMLDQISDGRLEFGVGRGYLKHDYDALGVPWDDKRFEKELDRRLARNFAFGNLTPPTGKPSPLGRTLNAADVNHDLVLIFTPRPILDKLAKLKDWKDPPAEVSKDYLPVWLALKRTEAVVATLDFGAEVFMRVEFRAAGAEGAKVVLEGLTVLLAKAKADYPGVRQELLSDLSPEVRTPILAVVDELISDHALVLDGNAVALTIRRPKNLVYQK